MEFMTKEEFDKLTPDQQKAIMDQIQKIKDDQLTLKKAEEKHPPLSMKELEDVCKGTMENMFKGMTSVDKKYFMFPGIGNNPNMADDLSAQGKGAKFKAFCRALIGGDRNTLVQMSSFEAKQRNLSEGSTTAGGFLVPEEFRAEIQRLEPLFGVIRRNARIIPMLYDTINIPAAGSTRQSANWTNEAAQILQTDPTFRQLTLTINKLASLPVVTSELLGDANVDVMNYLAMIIAEEFGKQEDIQGFNGTGSPFVGVLNATGVPTTPHASGSNVTSLSYPDLVKATTNIYTNATQGAKFYFHRTLIGHLRSLITTVGAPILGPSADSIAGYPFEAAEVLPNSGLTGQASATYAIFGNLNRGLAFGERGSITMDIGREGTVASNNLFEKDMVALRVIERVCMGVLLPSAFTKIVTAAS